MWFARRGPRVNAMEDAAAFLRAWDDPEAADNAELVDIHRTDAGNLNSTGSLGDYRGPALTRWHPQFESALEPGITELVRVIARERGWITYTSCEGHAYLGLGISPVERHVGILPRDLAERAVVSVALDRIRVAVRPRLRAYAVRLEVVGGMLSSGESSYPVVDFFFRRRRGASWGAYFRQVDDVYNAVVAEFGKAN